MWTGIINLLTKTAATSDDYGNRVVTEIKRQVFCDVNSIRQSEFYQAHTIGLKPELYFVVWALDYQGEQSIEYNSVRYEVLRTYQKNDKLELVCRRAVK